MGSISSEGRWTAFFSLRIQLLTCLGSFGSHPPRRVTAQLHCRVVFIAHFQGTKVAKDRPCRFVIDYVSLVHVNSDPPYPSTGDTEGSKLQPLARAAGRVAWSTQRMTGISSRLFLGDFGHQDAPFSCEQEEDVLQQLTFQPILHHCPRYGPGPAMQSIRSKPRSLRLAYDADYGIVR